MLPCLGLLCGLAMPPTMPVVYKPTGPAAGSGISITSPPLVSGNGIMATGATSIGDATGQVNYPAGIKSPGFGVSSVGNVTANKLNIIPSLVMSGTWGGTSDPSNALFYWRGNISGSCDNGGGICAAYQIVANNFAVTRVNGAGGMFDVHGNVGGAGQSGGMFWMSLGMNLNAATADVAGGASFYTTLTATATANHNDNGIGAGPTNSSGSVFATNFTCKLANGATFFRGCSGGEVNMSIQTGASADFLSGWSIVMLSDNNVAAGIESDGLLISAGGGTATLGYGINIGGYNGYLAIAPTGTIIGCLPHNGVGNCNNPAGSNSVANGIDFSLIAFTGSAFKSIGFSVDGTGKAAAITLQSTTKYSAAGTPLPTCNAGAEGTRAAVIDATAPAYNANYASGGAVHAAVYCNGTNWVMQ